MLATIVRANAAPVCLDERELPVSVSVGACTYPRHGSSELELRKHADLRMYEAKRAGGNRYLL